MPTYDELRDYFERQEGLREVARSASSNGVVLGFTLNVDPVWALFHDVAAGLLDRRVLRWIDYLGYDEARHVDFGDPTNSLAKFWWSPVTFLQGYRRRDLKFEDAEWRGFQDYCKSRDGRERLPVRLTVIHRGIPTPMVGDERSEARFESDELSSIQKLIEVVSNSYVAVGIEERPEARFAFDAGDLLNASGGKSGVLGGVLTDAGAGRSYGVTCAHVVAKGERVSDRSNSDMGECVAHSTRVPLGHPQVCDPVTLQMPVPYPGNGPDLNALDCALVELKSAVTMPSLAGIASALTPGQSVVMNARGKRMRFRLGSLALSYRFTDGSADYCFRDAIELLPQSRFGLGGALGALTAMMPTQGDSGSWVITDETRPVWAGMFFGEDGRRGFAIRASWIHTWSERVTGTTLRV